MYAGVPMTAPAMVSVDELLPGDAGASGRAADGRATRVGCRCALVSASSRLFASPQSMTTVSPNLPIKTFAGLRSRWMMRWLCAYAMASVAAAMRGSSASRASSVVAFAITLSSGSPCTCFIAKNGSPLGHRPAS